MESNHQEAQSDTTVADTPVQSPAAVAAEMVAVAAAEAVPTPADIETETTTDVTTADLKGQLTGGIKGVGMRDQGGGAGADQVVRRDQEFHLILRVVRSQCTKSKKVDSVMLQVYQWLSRSIMRTNICKI